MSRNILAKSSSNQRSGPEQRRAGTLRAKSDGTCSLSHIPSTILSLINESLIQSQKLNDCIRSFRAEMYNSTLSSAFCSPLLKTYLSYVSFVSLYYYIILLLIPAGPMQ